MSMMHGALVIVPMAVVVPVLGSTVYSVELLHVVAEP